MTRVDLFTTVHKGLRAVLFDTAALVARSEFARTDEAAAAVAGTHELLGCLDEHSAHEDAVILPVLAERAPDLHATLASDHLRVDGLAHEVRRLLVRLDGAPPPERTALGTRLHQRLGQLVAEHLQHMLREETEANRVLWAHLDDASLVALRGRITAAIAPERYAQWLAIVMPAANATERAAMLAGLLAR